MHTVHEAGAGIRTCKTLLVLCAVLYSTLAAFNNVTDYDANFEFVRHVLTMDTTFSGNEGAWRAIDAPVLHHVAYVAIIVFECLIAAIGWLAVARLFASRADRVAFAAHKALASYALTLGVLLWFGGFILIGGEWFLMWQSTTWNGVQSSFRIVTFFILVMLFLNTRD